MSVVVMAEVIEGGIERLINWKVMYLQEKRKNRGAEEKARFWLIDL